MIAQREQVAIYLANINKHAGILRQFFLTQEDEYLSALKEITVDMRLWFKTVKKYWKSNHDIAFAKALLYMDDCDFIKCYLKKHKGNVSGWLLRDSEGFLRYISRLKTEASIYLGEIQFPVSLDLTRELNELHSLPFMQEAHQAGFLDAKFQPVKNLTRAQIKMLAFAIGTRLNLPNRKRWVLFEELWDYKFLNSCPMSDENSVQFKKIRTNYSDIDFEELFNSKKHSNFVTGFSQRRVKTMFHSLMDKGYVDSSTTDEQILGAFGRIEKTKPINWIKSLRQLAYFIKTALADTNENIWVTTRDCFVLSNKKINRASLKSALGHVTSHGKLESYNSDIIKIAEWYNRPVRKIKKVHHEDG